MEDVNDIFGKILYEFPVERINLNFPDWVDGLDDEHPLKQELYTNIKEAFKNTNAVKNINVGIEKINSTEIKRNKLRKRICKFRNYITRRTILSSTNRNNRSRCTK